MDIKMDMINTATLEITPELLNLITEIDEFKGAWQALGTLAPERLSALRRVATIESVGSSTRIEGNRLSDREVEKLLGKMRVSSILCKFCLEIGGKIVICWPSSRSNPYIEYKALRILR